MAFNQGNTKAGKLTAVEVLEIREKYATGLYTYDRLALEYGVATNTIRSIVKGTSWQQVPMVTPQHVVDDAAMRSQRRLEAMLAQADGLPAEAVEVDEATLAAMEQAVQKIPQPGFLKPNADQAARMAAYGVRPPEPKELIEALARPEQVYDFEGKAVQQEMSERAAAARIVHAAEQGKPAIQAQSTQECGEGSTDAPAAADDAEMGMSEHRRQATPGQNSSGPLDEVTEESAK